MLQSTNVTLNINGGETGTIGGQPTASNIAYNFARQYSHGTAGAALTAANLVPFSGTVSSGSPITLDLTNLPDLGGTVSLGKCLLFHLEVNNQGTSQAGGITYGGGANAFQGWAGAQTNRADANSFGCHFNQQGWTVDATHKLIPLVPDGTNTAGYRGFVLGY